MTEFQGIGVSPGLVMGRVHLILKNNAEDFKIVREDSDPGAEIEKYANARQQVLGYLQVIVDELSERGMKERAGIFEGHMEFIDDEDAVSEIENVLRSSSRSAESAVSEYYKECSDEMSAMDDPYLRERSADFLDVREKLLLSLQGLALRAVEDIPEGSVICCKELVPSDTALLDKTRVKGFITEKGSSASHIAILAKALGLPAVVGVTGFLDKISKDQPLYMDGGEGRVVLDPDTSFLRDAEKDMEEADERRKYLMENRFEPAVTGEGRRIKLMSNITSVEDAEKAAELGSEGVGLFRTEFLYSNRSSPLPEEQLVDVFGKVADIFTGKPVIVRTLDIGGDKPLPWLDLEPGENPFLGYRGVRIYEEFQELVETQIRALLKANAAVDRDLRIMFPMIISRGELDWCVELVRRMEAELKSESSAFRSCPVGVMIETPAASLVADELAEGADFFSIGSNDLTQYTLAVDRGNAAVNRLYDSLHPAVRRSIGHIVATAKARGVEVGLCGELGGSEEGLRFLAELDMDEISISGNFILEARDIIRCC